MKSIIKSAKTVEEAVDLGLKELGLDKSDTEIEIIQEPTKGFLGMFGGNDAIVKIRAKDKNTDINLDDIFGDLTKETSFEETVEDDLDEEIDDRFDDYYDFEDESEEIEEEISNVDSNNTFEEAIITEESYYEVSEDLEENSEDDTEEDLDQDFYEEESDEQNNEYDFDDSYEDDDEIDESEDNQDYEIYKSDKEKTINTRELTFSGEAVEITDEDSLEVVAEKTKKILEDILVKMHIETKVDYETNRNNIINLNLTDISENDTGIVIGSKGETLNAIQYTLSLLVNRNTKQFYRVTLNVADYRDRRKKSIENNARKVAFKVLKTKKSIALKPMNSYERRIVHYALQSYKEIETVSSGKFPNRKVVVKYKG